MTRLLILVIFFGACHSKPSPKAPDTTVVVDGKGTLTGSVHKVGKPCPDPSKHPECDGPAANQEIVLYKEDGKSEAARTMTTADGMFSVELPPGKYVILGPVGIGGQQGRTEVEVKRDETAKVAVRFDSGIR